MTTISKHSCKTKSQVARPARPAVPKLEASLLQQETGVFICCLLTWPGASHQSLYLLLDHLARCISSGNQGEHNLGGATEKRREVTNKEHNTCGRNTHTHTHTHISPKDKSR